MWLTKWYPSHICGNRKNIALRVPDHPVPRLLASELSLPITGTSANLTGQPACISADCVKNQFKTLVNVVIDGGTIRGTKSSTVIDASNDSIKLIREGTIGKNAIEEVLHLYEPRVSVTDVIVADPEYTFMDQNTLPIKIYFTINNAPETLEEVNVVLERIRKDGRIKHKR